MLTRPAIASPDVDGAKVKSDSSTFACRATSLARRLGLLLAAWSCGNSAAAAASLQVEPTLVEVVAPGAASSLTVRNGGSSEITVQIRLFRWTQSGGKETLEPTTDVVASPPAVKLAPGADNLVRVVRVSREPILAEESYRVLVDQLPQAQRGPLQQVNLQIRHSIPVFFLPRQRTEAAVTWSLAYEGPRLVVAAQNTGDRRLRISALALRDGAGRTIYFGNGLVGYVLSRSTMTWVAPAAPRDFGAGGSIQVSAQSDRGPVNFVAAPPIRR